MLNEVVKRGISKEGTFEQKPEEQAVQILGLGSFWEEGSTSAKVLRQSVPGRAEN